jgi:hypothetical protein
MAIPNAAPTPIIGGAATITAVASQPVTASVAKPIAFGFKGKQKKGKRKAKASGKVWVFPVLWCALCFLFLLLVFWCV